MSTDLEIIDQIRIASHLRDGMSEELRERTEGFEREFSSYLSAYLLRFRQATPISADAARSIAYAPTNKWAVLYSHVVENAIGRPHALLKERLTENSTTLVTTIKTLRREAMEAGMPTFPIGWWEDGFEEAPPLGGLFSQDEWENYRNIQWRRALDQLKVDQGVARYDPKQKRIIQLLDPVRCVQGCYYSSCRGEAATLAGRYSPRGQLASDSQHEPVGEQLHSQEDPCETRQ